MSVRSLGPVTARFGTVFAVENPAVFRVILRRLERLEVGVRPTVVCTSGQLSVAARRFLASMVESGSTIRYSGDFDAAGLTIARSLATRLGTSFQYWRFDVENYEAALRPYAQSVSAARLSSSSGDLPDLVAAISAGGAAFQEAIADALADDVIDFARGQKDVPLEAPAS